MRHEEINMAYSRGIVPCTESSTAKARTSSPVMSMYYLLLASWKFSFVARAVRGVSGVVRCWRHVQGEVFVRRCDVTTALLRTLS